MLALLAAAVRRSHDLGLMACGHRARLDGERVGLRAEDGVIASSGPGWAASPATRSSTAPGWRWCPGLVNAHTHAAMTLFRGYADDLPLMEWLTKQIWPVEERMTTRTSTGGRGWRAWR